MIQEKKKINLDTATIDELKIAAWDNLVQIEAMQKLQQILNSAIEKRTKMERNIPINMKK